MIRSALLRRLVSSIAIFMLVWCQTSGVAHAGSNAISGSIVESALEMPCHQTTTENRGDTTKQRDCQTRCQSRDASFETAKIHLPAIDALLLVVNYTLLRVPFAMGAVQNDQTAERAAPPPLRLVYGRLLI